jgi:hypothetical protein
MKEIFITLAKLMTKDQIIEKMQEALDEYKEAKLIGKDLEDAEHMITMGCHMYVLNQMEGDAKDIVADMNMVSKSVNFFKTGKN